MSKPIDSTILTRHEGFKPGILYCFFYSLRGKACKRCESQNICVRSTYKETQKGED